MAKTPLVQVGMVLIAVVVITLNIRDEYESRLNNHRSWISELREMIHPTHSDVSMVQSFHPVFGKDDADTMTWSIEPKSAGYVRYFGKSEPEGITEEQRLHLTYLEIEDKERSIKFPIDILKNDSMPDDELNIATNHQEIQKSTTIEFQPKLSEEHLMHLAFLEMEKKKRAGRVVSSNQNLKRTELTR